MCPFRILVIIFSLIIALFATMIALSKEPDEEMEQQNDKDGKSAPKSAWALFVDFWTGKYLYRESKRLMPWCFSKKEQDENEIDDEEEEEEKEEEVDTKTEVEENSNNIETKSNDLIESDSKSIESDWTELDHTAAYADLSESLSSSLQTDLKKSHLTSSDTTHHRHQSKFSSSLVGAVVS